MALQQFILLPREGIRATDPTSEVILKDLHMAASTHPGRVEELPTAHRPNIRILDTTLEDGPKLVEMEGAEAQAVNGQPGPVRLAAVVTYEQPKPIGAPVPADLGATPAATAVTRSVVVQCLDAASGSPLGHVLVSATSGGKSDHGMTDAMGLVTLTVAGNRFEQLWAETDPTHWGAYRTDLPIHGTAPTQIRIDPVSLPYKDAIAHYYGASNFDLTTGVVVGVIDTGVGPHNVLNLIGGEIAVVGEQPTQYDDWQGHGTHVAGLIGASPSPNSNVRGIAPGVPIRSYRVFGRNQVGATNYSIMKAMILADAHRCDIVNLSLGGGPPDDTVRDYIRDARDRGMLVVIAAGNNNRNTVTYPAAYPGATAVSALGAVGCFPSGSLCEGHVLRPPHSTANLDEFIASFSNVGSRVAVTAPGGRDLNFATKSIRPF
jgi:subtilisin